MSLKRIGVAGLFAMLALMSSQAAPASASEVQTKMSDFAKKIANLLKEEGQTDCAIGEITGPTDPASNSGPGLQKALTDALAKHKISNNASAFIVVKGEYFPVEVENKKEELIVRLTLSLRNKKGKKYEEMTADLNHKANDEIVKLLGLQVDMGKIPKADQPTRNEEIKKQLQKPPLHITDTKVKTREDSPYAVEVLVKRKGENEFKPVAPENKDGKGNAFIELKRGDVYRLRLHNSTKHEAAVAVTIDGVDAFQFFAPEKGRPSSFLVQPTSAREVIGWSRGTESVNEFLVGAFADSAAAKALKGSAKLGTINICFHPCWTGRTPPPEFDGSRSIDQNGTGLGKEIKQKSNILPRTIGPLMASITIRYNK